jgi:twitching motility protein PilT
MDNNTAPNNGFTYPDFSTKPAPVADNKPVQTYSATPTPIPNMQPKAPVQPTFELPQAPAPNPSNVVTEDTIGVVRSNLEDIIPSAPKPKALERKPLENNLADPASIQKAIKKETIIPVKEKINTEPNFKDLDNKATNTVVDSAPERTIDQLLKYTIDHNASDLHISVGYPAVVRIDGELVEVNDQIISPQDAEEIVFPILTDEKKENLEVNREIDLAYFYQGDINARFRVNAFYSMKNLSAAFRLIPSRVRTLEELLLPQLYNQFAQLKQGLILVTGPTGHGKSTTLAAIIEQVNRTRFAHIITIEDPIEYVFEGKKSLIDQREMDDDTHSWPIALRSALRQDPDVILVGEMRDYETIASAITLAETGHLVLATLHTNNTSQTIDRIIDVFPENQQPQIRSQLANILEAVIAQRLVPLDKGGRRAVSEIMINNPAVQNLIREGKAHQIDNVIRTSADIGMVSLERSLVSLIREGAISIQRAQEYAVYPEEILRLLKS